MNIREMRVEFRKFLERNGSKGAYTKPIYKKLINAHLWTLKKYLCNFSGIYRVEMGRRYKKSIPSIRDIYNIYTARKDKGLLDNFSYYLKNKTHFSYDIYNKPDPLRRKNINKKRFLKRLEARSNREANKSKLDEFIILILAEYIILHNYMWASKMKHTHIRSIDRFLTNFE